MTGALTGPPPGLDTVQLRGLRARGRHGVLAAERDLGQVFAVDLTLHLDTRAAGASDDLEDAVDYAAVAERVHAVLTGEPVALLEALAVRVAAAVLADVRVRAVDVAVHKPQAPVPVPFDDVVVSVHRRNPAARAVLALGANLGDPARALVSAVAALDGLPGTTVTASSPVYRTAPVTDPDRAGQAEPQPDYLNAVVAVTTTLDPPALLAACHAVEAAHGRDRSAGVRRWAPRVLDVDVLTVDGLDPRPGGPAPGGPAPGSPAPGSPAPGSPAPGSPGPGGPELPHPRAHERAFVLVPWAAMAPRDVLPGHGRVGDLAAAVDATGVDLLDDLVLWPRTPVAPTASPAGGVR